MINTIVQQVKQDFLYPIAPYHGQDQDYSISNRKLQQFASQIDYIAGLHTNGKISTSQACQTVEELWNKLELLIKN